jgi:hypothetical protein
MRLPNARPLALVLILPAVLILALVDSAQAVVDLGAPFNRSIISVVVTPSTDGAFTTHDIVVTWSFVLQDGAAVEDMSTDARISLSLGGRPRDRSPEALAWNIRAGHSHLCDGESCGKVVLSGVERALICDASDSRCHGPELTGVFRGVKLDPGTEITVTLVPSSGAEAEVDSSDDTYSIVFEPESTIP